MSLLVRTTPEADTQIRVIGDWWRKNRTASPDLFADEPAAAFELLGHAPYIGRLYRQSPVSDTRRILLEKDGLLDRSTAIGKRLEARARGWKKEWYLVGDV